MKILFVSYAESHSNKWVNELCRRGHDIYFVMQKSAVNQIEALDSRIKTIQLPVSGKKGYILNAFTLRRINKEIEPDVVNVHYASGYGTLARLAGIKNEVLSVWGSDVYDFPYKCRFNMWLIKKNLLHAKKLASTSCCMAKQVRKIIGDRKQIEITPFGINTEVFSPERYPHKEDDTITIGNIKVISPKYGIDDLVNAFDLLVNSLVVEGNQSIARKLRCVIYGRGEQTQEIEALIKEKNLSEYIQLPGEVKHSMVPELLSTIDIFCATSVLDSESFGVSVVEAEAMGVPVVATDVDGFKEVVDDGVTGFIVPRRDIQAICDSLKKLVLNSELRRSMGNKGRERVMRMYNFNDNVDTMEKIYQEIIGA